MKRARVRGLLTGAVVFIMMFACTIIAHAASGSVTFGSSSYSVKAGDEFNIGVYVKSDVNVAAYTFNITYDTTKLEYISGADGGGNGTLSFAGYPNSDYKKYWLTFRAKESGSCTIKVTNPYLGPTDTAYGDSLTISQASSAPITITGGSSSGGNTTTSGSADLKSIGIKETGFYGFSAGKTEYDITVNNELDKITVTATAADDKASVSISDTNLKVGTNYVYITVTGQDGATKKYTIIVRRKQASTTETTTTPPETTTPEPTTPPEPSTPDQPVTPPEVSDESLFTYNDVPLYFCETFDGVDIPEGYTETGITINDSYRAKALVDESGTRILLYLSEASGESGRLYVYSSSKDMIYPYIELKNSGHTYVIGEISAVSTLPTGYEKMTISIRDGEDEMPIMALYNSAAEGFYLIYASCDGGNPVLYQYDNVENTIQRFNNLVSSPSTGGSQSDTDEVNKLKTEIEELKTRNKSEMKIWLVVVVIFVVLCVLLLIAVFFLYNKTREQMEYAQYDEEDMDYYDEDDVYDDESIADNQKSYSGEEYDFGESDELEEDIDDNDFTFL